MLHLYRPLALFLAPAAFSRPRNATELSTRLERNVAFFLTNYLLFTAVIFVFSM